MEKRPNPAVLCGYAMALVLTLCDLVSGAELTNNAFRAIDSFTSRIEQEQYPLRYSREQFIKDVYVDLDNDIEETVRVLNSLSGDLYADMLVASVNAQREFRRSLPSIFSYSQTAHYQDRADADIFSSGRALANFAPENYTYCPTTMCSPGSKWVMWDAPFFTKETYKREAEYLGYEQNVSGFSTGVSRLLGESSAIGLAVGYDHRKLKGRDGYEMENKGDTLHLALYGGTAIGCLSVDAYAGFSRSWNKTKRTAFVERISYEPREDTHGETRLRDNVFSAGFKTSYVWILGNDMRIVPSLGLDVSHVRMSGDNEIDKSGIGDQSEAEVLLEVDKSNFTSVAMPVMVSVNRTFSSSLLAFGGHDSLWTPELRGGVVPQFGAKHANVALQYKGAQRGNSFIAESAPFARTYGTVGAGVKIKLKNKFIFNVDYDYSFRSKWGHHSLTGMYGVSF